MVKTKKLNSKKTKNDPDVEAQADLSDSTEKITQENGEVDMNNKKKAKSVTKKEEEEDKDNEDTSSQENGEDSDKKKPASKKSKAAKKEVKAASEPARKSMRTPKPVAVEATAETKKAKKRASSKSPVKSAKKTKAAEDYEVEEIVGLRVKNGKKEFKIRWKGYSSSDDSWEPEKHLSCQDLIEQYLENHKDDLQQAEEKKSPAKKAKSPAQAKKGKKTKTK